MRVALVSQQYPPETAHGGIGSQTHLKAHGLAALGHEVHVISQSTDDERHEYRDGLVRVTRIPGVEHRLPIYTEPARWLTYSVEVAAALAALHARLPLDVVDVPEYGAEGYIHLLNRTEYNCVPTAVHLHGPLVMFAHTMGWPEVDSDFYRVGTAMESTCLRLADAIFSSGSCSADWCAEHYGVRREQIATLHSGVDTRLFCPDGAHKESAPTIIFVGHIARSKGVESLLEAACRLAAAHPRLRLRMLGRGDATLTEELHRRAVGAGFPDLLDTPGFVDRQELPGHLRRAHVFAAPSIYEGGPGFVYLEAMACGLPVVACEGSGAAEVVVSGENGLLVPPRDVDALVRALHRLLSNPAEREVMGVRARQFALENADSDLCLRRLEAFYSTVAARNLTLEAKRNGLSNDSGPDSHPQWIRRSNSWARAVE